MAGKYHNTLISFVLVNCLFLTVPIGQIKADNGNVRDFGATGDGISDDTESIQRAVNSGSGSIYFPKGSYLITKTVVIDLDKTGFISVRGDGVAQLIMSGPGPAIMFTGTHFKSAAPDTFLENVWERQRMPIADGLAIVGAHPEAVGIEAVGTMQLTLTRISVRKALHGIHLTGTNRNIIISDCHLYDNNGAGIFYDNVNLHQSNISGSHISYNNGGGIVTKGGAVRNLHITGCDIESNMGPEYPPAANVFIDCTDNNFGTAEVAITGCTLQHNGTSPGSSNIRILGGSKPYSEYKKVNWGNVTITGNVLSDTEVNIHLNGCRGVAVSGNTFWKGHKYNMLIEECSDIVMGANVLDENPPYSPGVKKPGNSIIVKDCEDCTFTGLHIKNARNHPAALLIENCNRMNISDCTILDFDNVGLLLRNVSNSRMSGFLIHNSRNDSASIRVKVEGGKGNVFDDSIK